MAPSAEERAFSQDCSIDPTSANATGHYIPEAAVRRRRLSSVLSWRFRTIADGRFST